MMGLLPVKANRGKLSFCPKESTEDTEAARETTIGGEIKHIINTKHSKC